MGIFILVVENAPSRPEKAGPRIPKVNLGETFGALKHRNYRLFFFGQLVSLVGTWMQNVAQSWLIYDITNSKAYLGYVSFASSIPIFLVSLWAGVLLDRLPKRKVIIFTQVASMVLAFVLALDVFLKTIQPWHIIVMSFLLGCVNAVDMPARQSFVIEMVSREDLMNAIALNSTIFNAARIVGPSLAGVALAWLGAGWCFALNGFSFIAVILALMAMKIEDRIAEPTRAHPFKQVAEGLAYVKSNKTIRMLILVVAVSNLFAFSYSALMPSFAKDVLGAGEMGFGLLQSFVGIGALTGALLIASAKSTNKGFMLTLGNIGFPLAALLFSLSRSLPVSAFLLIIVGMGFMVQNATVNTLIQLNSEDSKRGRVMSIYTLVFQGFFPVGSLLTTSFAEVVGTPIASMTGEAIALFFGIIWFLKAPFVRKL
ncbi:MAG: MFS transporter [Caldisericales bacterium]|nr:MFS transporter [Caldisericales bacterium]